MTPTGAEPVRSVEIERTFDVDGQAPLPDWSGVPGVASVSAGERRELDAAYFDSADRALARAGCALRRRTGGPDEGWHIKSPRGAEGGRVELHWPLGDTDAVPERALAELAAVTEGPFEPLARIRNSRTVRYLLSDRGEVVAEFADDRVTTRDERGGAERSWREWEVELGPAAPAGADARAEFFDAVETVVRAAGGRPAASDSKLARALGR